MMWLVWRSEDNPQEMVLLFYPGIKGSDSEPQAYKTCAFT